MTTPEQVAGLLRELSWHRPHTVHVARAAVRALETTRDRLAAAHRTLPVSVAWADDLESVIARCGFVVDGWLPPCARPIPCGAHSSNKRSAAI